MLFVVLSLLPAGFAAVYFFGLKALSITAVCIIFCVGTEALIQKLTGQEVMIKDWSAVITGLLLAFILPLDIPLWLPAIGSVFAIGIGKQVFGGLGYNPLNPALLGRAFLQISWPVYINTRFVAPRGGTLSGIDSVTQATPLSLLKESRKMLLNPEIDAKLKEEALAALSKLGDSYIPYFMGQIGGSIGETCVPLLVLGALFLFWKNILTWEIPVTYIGSVFILTWIFGGREGLLTGDPIFHILTGGLIIGALYMATDMVTSPVTRNGQILFGLGCGVLTALIRIVGGYPEGVCYAILLMNLATPLIDRATAPKVFGQLPRKKQKEK
jgi:electron transport complex protein RnfD